MRTDVIALHPHPAAAAIVANATAAPSTAALRFLLIVMQSLQRRILRRASVFFYLAFVFPGSPALSHSNTDLLDAFN